VEESTLIVAQLVKTFSSFLLGPQSFEQRIRKNLPLVSILSDLNSVHVLISYFLKIDFNISLPSATRSSKFSI
jgi:hypothetical protein